MMDAPRRGDWPGLAAFTAQLLADRREGLDAADRRIRIMAATTEVWRRVAAQEDLPELDEGEALSASWNEMHEDLALVAARVAQRRRTAETRADIDPELFERILDADELARTLVAYHQPHGDSTPLILFIHGVNQLARVRRGAPRIDIGIPISGRTTAKAA